MNHTMNHSNGPSDISRVSESFSHDPRQLDRVSMLLTGLISKSDKGDQASSKIKAYVGIALFKYVMRYGSGNSSYFNRDRLVTSGRYTSKWQDLFLHLIAAEGLDIDPIRLESVLSRSSTLTCDSTQAISNAIGQGIAMKNLAMLYNKPSLELLNDMIWCVIDDANFLQGSALETVALAGCWKLNNLCVIYDGIQGAPSPSADVLKTRGWNVIELVNDDDLTITAVYIALSTARRSNVPTFVNIQPPDNTTPRRLSLLPNLNTPLPLVIELYDFFQDVNKKGRVYEADWLVKVKTYQELYPALAKEFWNNVAGKNLVRPTGSITPPLSPLPRSRRGKHSSLGRNKPSQRPGRRSTPDGKKSETLHIRPCDAEEVAGAFLVSIRSTELPTTISLPQNGTSSFPGHSSRLGVTLGAYAFSSRHGEKFDMTLISAGVGIHYAMGTQDFLLKKYCLKARVVSFPCLKLFQLQTEEYKRSVLQPQSGRPTVAIDFGNSQGWESYADALVSLEEDGGEMGNNQPDKIGPRVKAFVKEVNKRHAR